MPTTVLLIAINKQAGSKRTYKDKLAMISSIDGYSLIVQSDL